MLLGEPPRTAYDLNLAVAGIPVRVHPFFWLAGLILGARSGDGALILIWIGALFVSILVHELGHAFTMRYYGESARVVLYMMGGLAIRDSSPYEFGSGRQRTPKQQITISAAGPGAGFVLAAMVIALVYAGGGAVRFDPSGAGFISLQLERGVPLYESMFDFPNADEWEALEGEKKADDEKDRSAPPDNDQTPRRVAPVKNNNYYLANMIHDLLWINIFWGLINLLPIYPLDGGRFLAR